MIIKSKTFQWVVGIILTGIGIYIMYLQYKKTDPEGDTIIVTNINQVKGEEVDNTGARTKQPHKVDPAVTYVPASVNSSPHENKLPKEEVILSDEYINKAAEKTDIAILILDANNDQVNAVSSGIANLYRSKGYSVTNSLFTAKLFQSPYLRDLENANSKLIDKLELPARVKYIVLGRYSGTTGPGTGENSKFVCRAKLDVRVISSTSRSQINGFELIVFNGHGDIDHAEKGAIEKLMADYSANHLNF